MKLSVGSFDWTRLTRAKSAPGEASPAADSPRTAPPKSAEDVGAIRGLVFVLIFYLFLAVIGFGAWWVWTLWR